MYFLISWVILMSLLLSFIFMSSLFSFHVIYLFIYVCFYLKVVHAIFNFLFQFFSLFDFVWCLFRLWLDMKVKQIRIPLIYIYILKQMENPSSRQEQHKVDRVWTPLVNLKEPQGLRRRCLIYFGSMLEKIYGDFNFFLISSKCDDCAGLLTLVKFT